MRLGRYYVPENRLIPTVIEDINRLYKSVNDVHNFSNRELATILGYDKPEGGAFYRKISSLLCYGLIEQRNRRSWITEMGENVVQCDNDVDRQQLYRSIILRVDLWRELYQKFPNGLPDDLATHLKNITDTDIEHAVMYEKNIRIWYTEDLKLLSQHTSPNNKTITIQEIKRIPFGQNILICLPKKDMKRWWEKTKKYMEIFLEYHDTLKS